MAKSGPGGQRKSEDTPRDAALDETIAASDESGPIALGETVAATDDSGPVALEETVAADDVALDATMAPPLDGGRTASGKGGSSQHLNSSRVVTRSDGRKRHHALQRGDELGRYVVLELLGAGGMGEVYTAYDPELDRKIAVKVIREKEGALMETAAKARLLAEAQALARLSHPNVVTVYDVGTVGDERDGDVYIAMEFIDGITFSDWRASEPRSWQECVEVLAEAGRGLAAAHNAGLVHRDFKPDNVLIGKDGRVRVIDFGVALQESDVVPVMDDPKRRDQSATTTGGLVGTPAYMAPEQFEGGALAATTDQFAFGIALYEALTGRLPFEGNTLLALAESVTAGEPREFDRDSRVPGWLQAIVFRALERQPTGRFASMPELVAALQPKAAGPRLWLVATFLAVSIAAVVVTFVVSRSDDRKCLGFAQDLSKVWSGGAKDEIVGKIGAEAFARVETPLDDYGRQWVTSKEAACRATRETGEQSERVLTLRNTCLDTRLRELDAVVAILRAGSSNPEQAVAGLRSLSHCDNLAALDGSAPPPADADPEAVRSIESDLVKARAFNSAGDLQMAQEAQARAESAAKSLGWEGARAEALVVRGMIESNLGDPKKARETLFEAVRVAAAADAATCEADAWINLVLTESAGMSEPEEALRWAEHAEVALARAGGEQTLKGHLAFNKGSAYRLLKDNEEALRHYREAKALYEHALGPDHYRVARARGAIGTVLRRMGNVDEAERELRAALRRFEELFGPDSPSLGPFLNNLGLLLRERRDYAAAKELLERSLRIKEKGLGVNHPGVATAVINLALLEQRLGNFEEVEKLWKRSHDIRVAALGDDHRKVTWSLTWRTLFLFNAGKNEESLEMAERAAIRYRAEEGANSYDLASNLGVQCELQRRLGALTKASALCAQADKMYAELGDRPSVSLYLDAYVAQLRLDRRDLTGAAKRIERAIAKLPELKGDATLAQAHIEGARGRLLHARGEAQPARAAMAKAKELYEEMGAGHRYYVQTIDSLTAGW